MGNVVYFGKPSNSLSYLKSLDLACPDGYNAADHWMDLLVSPAEAEEHPPESEEHPLFNFYDAQLSEVDLHRSDRWNVVVAGGLHRTNIQGSISILLFHHDLLGI